jgi:diguanylate cyclase (GGDEF)-like protein/PAS domain S-box-containing protein
VVPAFDPVSAARIDRDDQDDERADDRHDQRRDERRGLPGTTVPDADRRRARLLVARKWAYQLSGIVYIPLPYPQVEAELVDLVDQLFDTLLREPFEPESAVTVGARLVEMNCVGRPAFGRTMDVLGKALVGQRETRGVPGLTEKVVALLGGLATGYADAVRQVTLDQQEALNRTMIAIGRDSRTGLRITEARLTAVLETATTGVAITDTEGHFLRTNPALGHLLGHSAGELAELTVFDVLAPEDHIYLTTARDQLVDGSLGRLHQRRTLLTKSGDEVPVTLTGTLVRDDDEPDRLVLVCQDDSELRLLQNQLTRQSLHDVVTGLPNRQFFTTRLETALHKADPGVGATLYHLDLDAFAMVADGLGRHAGDRLLKIVGDRLRTVVADEKAIVARLDSDEFAILLENSPRTPDIATIVGRINDTLAEPVQVDDQSVTVSASIGVVDRPRGDLDPTELLRASDLALRRAKRHGRRQWELFDQDLDDRDRARFKLATTMPSAWELGEVQLDYRPQVALASGDAVGLEPVLRWDHPRFGPVGHRRCVELAEQTGLMLSLGDWLLHSACAWLHRRPELELPLVVELSDGQAVDPDLVGRVLRILAEDGLPPERLRLGIPVHLLGGDRPEPADHLRVLADAGVGVALHGFGGGATDLVHLEDLPVAAVRIGPDVAATQARRSGSLLDNVLTDLVFVAHRAGATVAVDGIDTEEQANWWRDAGADTGLGHQFTTW